MTSHWNEAPLGKLLLRLFDHRGRTPKKLGGDFSDSGVRVISAKNIRKGRLDLALNPRYISQEMFDRWMPEKLTAGDVLLTSEAPMGSVAFLGGVPNYCLGQRLFALRADPRFLDGRFLYYVLQSPLVQSRLRARVSGTTAEGIRQAELVQVSLPHPPLREQRVISGVLGALDDLIENNLGRITLLERMTQAIYREWFVHFRYPGHEEDKLVDSALGLIPSRWEIRPLFDEAEVAFGFALKSRGFGSTGDWAVIRIRDVLAGRTATFTDEFPGPRYIVENGDTLIGMDGDFHMGRWSGGEAVLNQRVTRIRRAGRLGSEALFRSLRDPIRRWNESIVGTTVAHLGKRHLESIALAVPPDETAIALNRALDPLGEAALLLRQSNDRLASLRDLLLPKLVTGALDVSHLDLDTPFDEAAA